MADITRFAGQQALPFSVSRLSLLPPLPPPRALFRPRHPSLPRPSSNPARNPSTYEVVSFDNSNPPQTTCLSALEDSVRTTSSRVPASGPLVLVVASEAPTPEEVGLSRDSFLLRGPLCVSNCLFVCIFFVLAPLSDSRQEKPGAPDVDPRRWRRPHAQEAKRKPANSRLQQHPFARDAVLTNRNLRVSSTLSDNTATREGTKKEHGPA